MAEVKVWDVGVRVGHWLLVACFAIAYLTEGEPEWLLDFRLKAFAQWLKMEEPKWPNVHYPKIDFQAISYYSAPKAKKLKSMDEVDPELLRTFEKLGVPMHEQKALAGEALSRAGERLEGLEAARETLYLNLRRTRGADPAEFRNRTGMELRAMMTGLERVVDAGLLETVADGTVRLTRQGRFLADTVSSEVLTRAGEPN